ncbi:hypothetical protein AKJ16_DCAP12337 [Drosera capensis]
MTKKRVHYKLMWVSPTLSQVNAIPTEAENSFSQIEQESAHTEILQSIVPPRLYLAVKGYSYHEYLSSLAQISRSEPFQLSQDSENTRRPRRIAGHYWFNGRLSLSPDDISALVNHDCYGKSTMPDQQIMLCDRVFIQHRKPEAVNGAHV